MTAKIKCRAKVAAGCLDGTAGFYADDVSWTDDGTFDGETVVCDECYCAVMPRTPSGRGLSHELDAAIATTQEATNA
jgi:hypothetical protein